MNQPGVELKAKQKPSGGLQVDGGSREARQVAAVILEVLAGERLPGEAAEALSISLPRYYTLELRALEGLVKSCEPRVKGRARPPEREMTELRKQVERLERECARKQALVRAAQRAVGLTIVPKSSGKRKRRPTVRALKVAAVLRSGQEAEPRESSENG